MAIHKTLKSWNELSVEYAKLSGAIAELEEQRNEIAAKLKILDKDAIDEAEMQHMGGSKYYSISGHTFQITQYGIYRITVIPL